MAHSGGGIIDHPLDKLNFIFLFEPFCLYCLLWTQPQNLPKLTSIAFGFLYFPPWKDELIWIFTTSVFRRSGEICSLASPTPLYHLDYFSNFHPCWSKSHRSAGASYVSSLISEKPLKPCNCPEVPVNQPLKIYFYFKYMSILPSYMYVHCIYSWCPWRSENVDFPGNWIKDNYKSPCRCRELNLGLLQGKQALLIAKLSL